VPETECGFDNIPSGPSGSVLLVRLGPTLFVDIGFDPSWVPKQNTPTPGIRHVEALVDTGASESCIDDLLAAGLNLPIIDRRPIAGIAGQHMANVYLAQIRAPDLHFIQYGTFAGVNLAAGGQVHKALIGRTFLRNFRMAYEGTTGKVTISSS
jgi:predicted aspartyl protease